MDVQFRKTGERRYAVTILRENQAPLEMNPAPGYDPMMPHDLLHLIVESELGLQQGIYGQIAQGGTAGTFHPTASTGQNLRETKRLRKRLAKRGEKLLHEGRQESAASEQATYICLQEWLSRSRQSATRQQTKQATRPPAMTEGFSLSEERLERILARMDELSSQWAGLKIGESMTIRWPAGTDAH